MYHTDGCDGRSCDECAAAWREYQRELDRQWAEHAGDGPGPQDDEGTRWA